MIKYCLEEGCLSATDVQCSICSGFRCINTHLFFCVECDEAACIACVDKCCFQERGATFKNFKRFYDEIEVLDVQYMYLLERNDAPPHFQAIREAAMEKAVF